MRNSILESIMGQLDGDALTRLSQLTGTDEEQARQGLSAAIPMLLGGMERNTAKKGGAEDLKRALQMDHDGSILDNINGYLGKPDLADGAGILKHVLGDKRRVVERKLAQRTEMTEGSLSNLLELAAPLVMGALGKQQRESGLGAGMLGNFLSGQREASESSGGMLGMVTDLLDSDGDGDIMDDIGGIAGKLFGR